MNLGCPTMIAQASQGGDAGAGILLVLAIGFVLWFITDRRVRCPRCGHQAAVKHVKDGRCPCCGSAEH